eukprot:scaffold7410_cov169-Ochromonas_danica.AAC.6
MALAFLDRSFVESGGPRIVSVRQQKRENIVHPNRLQRLLNSLLEDLLVNSPGRTLPFSVRSEAMKYRVIDQQAAVRTKLANTGYYYAVSFPSGRLDILPCLSRLRRLNSLEVNFPLSVELFYVSDRRLLHPSCRIENSLQTSLAPFFSDGGLNVEDNYPWVYELLLGRMADFASSLPASHLNGLPISLIEDWKHFSQDWSIYKPRLDRTDQLMMKQYEKRTSLRLKTALSCEATSSGDLLRLVQAHLDALPRPVPRELRLKRDFPLFHNFHPLAKDWSRLIEGCGRQLFSINKDNHLDWRLNRREVHNPGYDELTRDAMQQRREKTEDLLRKYCGFCYKTKSEDVSRYGGRLRERWLEPDGDEEMHQTTQSRSRSDLLLSRASRRKAKLGQLMAQSLVLQERQQEVYEEYRESHPWLKSKRRDLRMKRRIVREKKRARAEQRRLKRAEAESVRQMKEEGEDDGQRKEIREEEGEDGNSVANGVPGEGDGQRKETREEEGEDGNAEANNVLKGESLGRTEDDSDDSDDSMAIPPYTATIQHLNGGYAYHPPPHRFHLHCYGMSDVGSFLPDTQAYDTTLLVHPQPGDKGAESDFQMAMIYDCHPLPLLRKGGRKEQQHLEHEGDEKASEIFPSQDYPLSQQSSASVPPRTVWNITSTQTSNDDEQTSEKINYLSTQHERDDEDEEVIFTSVSFIQPDGATKVISQPFPTPLSLPSTAGSAAAAFQSSSSGAPRAVEQDERSLGEPVSGKKRKNFFVFDCLQEPSKVDLEEIGPPSAELMDYIREMAAAKLTSKNDSDRLKIFDGRFSESALVAMAVVLEESVRQLMQDWYRCGSVLPFDQANLRKAVFVQLNGCPDPAKVTLSMLRSYLEAMFNRDLVIYSDLIQHYFEQYLADYRTLHHPPAPTPLPAIRPVAHHLGQLGSEGQALRLPKEPFTYSLINRLQEFTTPRVAFEGLKPELEELRSFYSDLLSSNSSAKEMLTDVKEETIV